MVRRVPECVTTFAFNSGISLVKYFFVNPVLLCYYASMLKVKFSVFSYFLLEKLVFLLEL